MQDKKTDVSAPVAMRATGNAVRPTPIRESDQRIVRLPKIFHASLCIKRILNAASPTRRIRLMDVLADQEPACSASRTQTRPTVQSHQWNFEKWQL